MPGWTTLITIDLGGSIIPEGTVFDNPGDMLAAGLSQADVESLCAGGAIAPTPEPEPEPEPPRQAQLHRAIAALTPDEPDHWRQDGRPEIRALKQLSGIKKITGAERDAAWASYPSGGTARAETQE